MIWKSDSRFLVVVSIIGFLVLVFSIYDILSDKGFIIAIIAAYAILIGVVIILLFFGFKEKEILINSVEDFEKKLYGGLFHFKCPTCEGIFAIKKSKRNNKKPIKMTCPDCGAIGIVSPNPVFIEEEIPEKKSIKANFKCLSCNEGITVWAEGSDLYKSINVYSCPFCGEEKAMDRF